MIECISDLRLFFAISRTLNFREAGKKLGYSPAVVSSRMKRLEVMTGKTLFIRSTRHIKLTEEGEQMRQLAQQMLDLAELMSGSHDAAGGADLRGTVRIAAPSSFARLFLQAPITRLMREHPELSIDLILDDGITQMVREGVDISFRVGGEEEPGTESVFLMQDERILVASPAYLAERGEPTLPQDLRNHVCLSYPHARHWTLHQERKSVRVALQSVMFCNTGDYLRRLAMSGAGITMKSDWSVQAELQTGSLRRVLPGFTAGPAQQIKALLPRREYVPTRVSYVLNAIRHCIKEAV